MAACTQSEFNEQLAAAKESIDQLEGVRKLLEERHQAVCTVRELEHKAAGPGTNLWLQTRQSMAQAQECLFTAERLESHIARVRAELHAMSQMLNGR